MARAVATYQFTAEADDQLTFEKGDVINVVEQEDGDWWKGELNGQQGYFPNNYVEIQEVKPPPARGPPPGRGAPPGRGRPPAGRGAPPGGRGAPPAGRGRGGPPPGHGHEFQPQAHQQQQQQQGAAMDASYIASKSPPPFKSFQERQAAIQSLSSPEGKHLKVPTFDGQRQGHGSFAGSVTIYDVSDADKAITEIDESKVDDTFASPKNDVGSKELSVSRTRVGYFASNLAVASSFMGVLMGLVAIGLGITDQGQYGTTSVLIGAYAVVLGVMDTIWEVWYGYSRSPNRIPKRGIAYLILSVPLFFSIPLEMVAIGYLSCAIVQFKSAQMREKFEVPKKRIGNKSSSGGGGALHWNDEITIPQHIRLWVQAQQESNKLGKTIFLLAYLVFNIYLFSSNTIAFQEFLLDYDEETTPLSAWGPYAKGFGLMLDFNCAIILVPVARSFIRWLYNISTRDQGSVSKTFRVLLIFFPIDKTLAFHKLVAWVILFAATGHTVCHFVNYGLNTTIIGVFGLVPWISGGFIILAMLFMYTAAVRNVKGTHFELFWFTHHLFILFYVGLLVHDITDGEGNVWKWFIVPGVLYTAERFLREARAGQDATLMSVTWMYPDVYSIRFAKSGVFSDGYKEGQYMFLNCPHVSKHEWHPFTISSAPGEEFVSVHIRIMNMTNDPTAEKSWTQGTSDYLRLMSPKGAVYHEFVTNTPDGVARGRSTGPDAKSIIRVDGPHSAPTQHISEYDTCMIVGAGIGVTPLAATMKSIVHYRWRTAVGKAYPDNAHFYWVCSSRDINSFRWMVRTIKEAADAVTDMKNKNEGMKHREFSVHCYITSVKKDAQPMAYEKIPPSDGPGTIKFWGVPRKGTRGLQLGESSFTEQEFFQTCTAPPDHVVLGEYVHVYRGRPKWDEKFGELKGPHSKKCAIGVVYCGNVFIAHDLKEMCKKHSSATDERFFRLHKENF